MTKDELHDKAISLPLKPGVYLMMNKEGLVIYVGKAKKLRNRVSQYFEENRSHNDKTRAMVSQVDHFDTIVVRTEFEALVLENSLIKRHQPKYNILLKDDKGYPFVRLGVGDYPHFSLVSKIQEDGADYFGPFGGRNDTKAAIDAVLTALKLPTCSRQFPRDIGKERPCLNYHIGKCDGFCRLDGPDATDYTNRISLAKQLFDGKVKDLEASLRADMEKAADELQFEQAAVLRDRLKSLDILRKQQQVIAGVCADTDVWGIYQGDVHCGYGILHIENGNILGRKVGVLSLGVQESMEDILCSILLQYYLNKSIIPKEILIPFESEDVSVLSAFLTEQSGHKVEIKMPQRGQRNHLVAMAINNAKEEIERITTDFERTNKILQQLQFLGNLPTIPHRIESFDISNTGKDDMVASMVVFVDGKPFKKDYRKFSINNLVHPDDYASMHQVITRRLQRYKDGDEKFTPLPDLFLIDGGQEHARVAIQAQNDIGIHVPTLGMVKDDHHRTRALITADGLELGLQSIPYLYSFIGNIQEEVHRFAITYHRQKHIKSAYKSKLDDIPGLGEKRKEKLKKYFGSISQIESASEEELQAILPKSSAHFLFQKLHDKKV